MFENVFNLSPQEFSHRMSCDNPLLYIQTGQP